MSLEDIRTIEAFLRGGPGPRTEVAYHRSLVVSQGVTVLVVFARETFLMIFADYDGALLRSFGLMRQHMRLEVLEVSTTVRVGASSPFFSVVIKAKASRA